MNVQTDTKLQSFLSGFEGVRENAIQNEAWDALQYLDFPTTRDEYWKYTRISKIANAKLSSGKASNTILDLEKHLLSDQFVIIENGIFRADLSSFDLSKVNVKVESTDTLVQTTANMDELFQAMNTALAEQTLFISIPKKQVWETPVQVIYITTENQIMSNTRLVFESEDFAEGHVITTFINEGNSQSLSNHYTEVLVAENAHLKLDKIQVGNGWHVATENVWQDGNSTFKINTMTLKGDIVRNNLNIEVAGENCETFLNGAVITKENQLVDNHSFVNHLVSNCMSDENYKYVLDGKSTGVFNGRVVVQPDAQKINAYQQNGNVLLSDFAKINSKPELEIYADDVKCSHGSTTGQLDEDALFYLQARGISKDKARKILVSAFVGEVLQSLDNEKVLAYVNQVLFDEFGWTEM
ncbi:Fe-S cluster assembly protein SufD [Putridiphycobacter roseus]|nr:Fe-S cluster assembly protein SufD [Putridiphycobacter roseus]